jgi:acetyl-CoA C-acetyltransferase
MAAAVFIASAARTPVGAFLGALSQVAAPTLGAVAIAEACKRAGVSASLVEHVFMGSALTAGVGQAPARQAAFGAGLEAHTPATTVGKVCGSGLEAVILGARAIALGEASLVIAGGMESMSLAPYVLPKARTGQRLGHGELIDSMIRDGLFDPYGHFHMAHAAERCATELGIGRDAQDAFARRSYERARAAEAAGSFDAEIAAVEIASKRGQVDVVRKDEEPGRADLDKLASLKPAFASDGTITAGNASKINDGAAALLLASEATVKTHGLTPLARIVSYAHHAQKPEHFPTAPVFAIDKALSRAALTHEDIDLFEINEAFSVVALACMQLAKLDPDRVNVHGGAVALGHPIGASGARILTTLLFAMRTRGLARGLCTLCIGGGEANAMIVERV